MNGKVNCMACLASPFGHRSEGGLIKRRGSSVLHAAMHHFGIPVCAYEPGPLGRPRLRKEFDVG